MIRESLYKSVDTSGEYFALNAPKSGKFINFWHVTKTQTFLYTFTPSDKFHSKTRWTDEVCRELLADLRQPKPSCEVQRFAVNGQLIFTSEPDFWGKKLIPSVPERGSREQELAAWEETEGGKPAPYVLYGRHLRNNKEYSWWLNPNIPGRQGIVPGDRVFVWTKMGKQVVLVSRIEEATGDVHPTARVIKKVKAKNPPDET